MLQGTHGVTSVLHRMVLDNHGDGMLKFKSKELLENLVGNMGIGHVRYPTAGGDNVNEAQPFYTANPINVTLAHNGTLTNSEKLKKDLVKTHFCQFNTNSDSEVLLKQFCYELYKTNFRTLGPKFYFTNG